MTGEQLSNLSCNEDEFIKASSEHQNVLKNSDFKDKLVYTPSNQRNRRQRNRKNIWYNPPFDLQVKKTLAKPFYNYWTEISNPFIDYIRLSIRTLSKLVIPVCLTWHHTSLLIIKASYKNLTNHNIQSQNM